MNWRDLLAYAIPILIKVTLLGMGVVALVIQMLKQEFWGAVALVVGVLVISRIMDRNPKDSSRVVSRRPK